MTGKLYSFAPYWQDYELKEIKAIKVTLSPDELIKENNFRSWKIVRFELWLQVFLNISTIWTIFMKNVFLPWHCQLDRSLWGSVLAESDVVLDQVGEVGTQSAKLILESKDLSFFSSKTLLQGEVDIAEASLNMMFTPDCTNIRMFTARDNRKKLKMYFPCRFFQRRNLQEPFELTGQCYLETWKEL